MRSSRKSVSVPVLVMALIILLCTPIVVLAALTKTGTELDAWARVAEDTLREGATSDISGCYTAGLYIDVACTDANASEGIQIRVQISPATTGDDTWIDYTKFIAVSGSTADSEATVGAIGADANTIIDVADTDAGIWETEGSRWIFILDGTAANSELVFLVSYVNDASIVIQDVADLAHDSGVMMWDQAERFYINVPALGMNRLRVLYDNTYDGDGTDNDFHTHAHIVKNTALQ